MTATASVVRNYGRSVKENGLKATLRLRDEHFGDGMGRVGEPEGRDPMVRARSERRAQE